MKKELIISTDHTLGGSPRLEGRRLDVRHVIWGITEFDHGDMQSYQDNFEVTTDEIRHAIMYCKDQICELQDVPQSCNGCSKRFRKDTETWEEYLKEMGGIENIETDGDPIITLGGDSILPGELEDHKKDFEGVNSWETARKLHLKLKDQLNLPASYEQIIDEIN
ncbi:hypothetical protein FNH22_04825 [Fulvivirga sp. M361]|uniref:hypothetical protein n=1 Tax=Fulvivirga sp. M361 TaxID=2594266 RepID=UPI00117A5978|nr:hypothetical protein [Fulvivirga sp. M361]TRX61383.1 hypothetical protein FNH22_04825 [Fulvivirga sp. M361]